jgi:hypothetical protein
MINTGSTSYQPHISRPCYENFPENRIIAHIGDTVTQRWNVGQTKHPADFENLRDVLFADRVADIAIHPL